MSEEPLDGRERRRDSLEDIRRDLASVEQLMRHGDTRSQETLKSGLELQAHDERRTDFPLPTSLAFMSRLGNKLPMPFRLYRHWKHLPHACDPGPSDAIDRSAIFNTIYQTTGSHTQRQGAKPGKTHASGPAPHPDSPPKPCSPSRTESRQREPRPSQSTAGCAPGGIC